MMLLCQAYRRALNVVQLHGPSDCAEAGLRFFFAVDQLIIILNPDESLS